MDKAVVVLLAGALDKLESALTWVKEDTASYRVINRVIGSLGAVKEIESRTS